MARLPQHLARIPVGRERLSREALASFQRDRIIDAATGVFAKRGYQATTVDNIVAVAKASVGNFYQHFDGKEDCFLGVFDRIVAAGRERVADALSDQESWAERAYAGLRELLEIYVSDSLSARIVLVEARTAGEAATLRYNALTDAAAAWLRQGRRDYPAARDLPETFEQAAVTGTAYFLHQRLLGSQEQSAWGLLEETAPLVLEPFVGPSELRKLGTEPAAR
jgi:AcrR family transcriptional regulator